MSNQPQNAKVIPFPRGARSAARAKAAVSTASSASPVQSMLAGLHPRVRAVLVARRSKWEYFERIRETGDARSVLQDISLPDLLRILHRAKSPGQLGQRITVSPWAGFDLAVLLRDGEPRYAACFDPDTSVYIAEAVLPEVASHFDKTPR